jgi:hypothetical protein
MAAAGLDYENSAAITVHGASSAEVHKTSLMQLQQLMLESDGEDGEDYVNQVSDYVLGMMFPADCHARRFQNTRTPVCSGLLEKKKSPPNMPDTPTHSHVLATPFCFTFWLLSLPLASFGSLFLWTLLYHHTDLARCRKRSSCMKGGAEVPDLRVLSKSLRCRLHTQPRQWMRQKIRPIVRSMSIRSEFRGAAICLRPAGFSRVCCCVPPEPTPPEPIRVWHRVLRSDIQHHH